MKIASYICEGVQSYGAVVEAGIINASHTLKNAYPSLLHLLQNGALDELSYDIEDRDTDFSLDEITLLKPLYNTQRFFCVGVNYPKKYPLDNPAPPPDNILLFAKLDGTLVAHNEILEIPLGKAGESFDYEGEIGLVIGKGGRHISKENAFNHIAGYTIVNDGSVRDWQKHSIHAGKNFANSGSCGPWMVTADEIDDPVSMQLTTHLNGEEVQNTTVSKMVFSIPELIAYISHTIDLRPGDVIATGSPEGAGGSRVPPRFLRSGDQLDFIVSGIGVLSNRVGRV